MRRRGGYQPPAVPRPTRRGDPRGRPQIRTQPVGAGVPDGPEIRVPAGSV